MDENNQITREEMIALVINSKYSISDQIAILRQKDSKPDEWDEFYNFAEEVKRKVTEEYALKMKSKSEEITDWYEEAKRRYPNSWSDAYLKILVEDGKLTVREYREIIGKEE